MKSRGGPAVYLDMSDDIKQRLIDAKVLAQAGRLEGALLCVLATVAATAEKRFPAGTPSTRSFDKKGKPNPMLDAERFELFLEGSIGPQMGMMIQAKTLIVIETPEGPLPFTRVIYKWMRCSLVHEAGIATTIIQMLPPTEHGITIRAGDASKGAPVAVSANIIDVLANAVMAAPENVATFPPRSASPASSP